MHAVIAQLQSLFDRLKARKRFQDAMDTATLGVIFLEIFTIFVLFFYGVGIIGLASVFRLVSLAAIIVLIFGLLFRRFVKRDFRRLMDSVDLHYDLKDRLLTASSVLSRPDLSPMERLQLCDAALHARQVVPSEVLPMRPPRHFRLVCGLALLLPVAVYLAFSNGFQQFSHDNETTAELGKRLDEELVKPLERLSQEHPREKPLAENVEQLRSLNDRIGKTTVDFHETLATLSRMERILAQAQHEFLSEATTVSLAEIGAALSASKATQATGSALQTGDFSLASKELRSVPWNQVTPPEREITGKMLQDAAEKIKRRNLSQLSQVAERLAGDLLQGTLEDLQLTAAELAEISQTADSNREIQRSLEEKLALLQERKADFTAASNGGQATQPSEMPSQAWGKGDAGDPRTGPATQLDAISQLQRLQGLPGTGPSETETIFSSDAAQETTGRPYTDVDRRSHQTAETALETEPIPLKRRQVIRKYFEQTTNDN